MWHFDDLAQDCSNSIANALELLQSCTKPSVQEFNEIASQEIYPMVCAYMYHVCFSVTSLKLGPGIILCMRPANERRRYTVTSPFDTTIQVRNVTWVNVSYGGTRTDNVSIQNKAQHKTSVHILWNTVIIRSRGEALIQSNWFGISRTHST